MLTGDISACTTSRIVHYNDGCALLYRGSNADDPAGHPAAILSFKYFGGKHQRKGLLVIEACLSAFYSKRRIKATRLIEFGSKNQQV